VVNAGVHGFNAIEDGGGFKREIKGGEMKARWYRLGGTHGVELGGARWPGISGGTGELRRLEVGYGTDNWGPVDRETWERRSAQKARTKREDVFPAKTRPTHGLDGPAGTVLACGGGAASGLAGPEAEWAARLAGPKSRKRISELKIGFLNLPTVWKFVEGDLGGILT
jgi:hypothetical protein